MKQLDITYRRNYHDYTNLTINKLIFIRDSGRRNTGGNALWVVQCYCGNEFISKPSRIKSGSTTSCGCHQKQTIADRSKKQRGAKHPNWNPSLTDEQRYKNRDLQEVVDWRKAVYERDDYTCQCCYKKGVDLTLTI